MRILHLETRFNKALVMSQLKAFFNYSKDAELYDDLNKLHNAWVATAEAVGDRPRFFNIKDVFKISKDILILTSSYGSMHHNGNEYNVLTIYGGPNNRIQFGLPVHRTVSSILGGSNMVCRVVIAKGIDGLIKLMLEVEPTIKEYEDRARLRSNVELLQSFVGKIYYAETQ